MSGKHWSPEDHAEFARLAHRGFSARMIGARLNRTESAIWCRAYFNGISLTKSASSRADEALWDRLAWRHGPERADAITEGRDPRTQADLGAWRSLGRRDAA